MYYYEDGGKKESLVACSGASSSSSSSQFRVTSEDARLPKHDHVDRSSYLSSIAGTSSDGGRSLVHNNTFGAASTGNNSLSITSTNITTSEDSSSSSFSDADESSVSDSSDSELEDEAKYFKEKAAFDFWYPDWDAWKFRRTLAYWISVTCLEGSILFVLGIIEPIRFGFLSYLYIGIKRYNNM